MDKKALNDKWLELKKTESLICSELQELNSKLDEIEHEQNELWNKAVNEGYIYDFDEWVKEGDELHNPLLELDESEFPILGELLTESVLLSESEFEEYIIQNPANQVIVDFCKDLNKSIANNNTRMQNRLFSYIKEIGEIRPKPHR